MSDDKGITTIIGPSTTVQVEGGYRARASIFKHLLYSRAEEIDGTSLAAALALEIRESDCSRCGIECSKMKVEGKSFVMAELKDANAVELFELDSGPCKDRGAHLEKE